MYLEPWKILISTKSKHCVVRCRLEVATDVAQKTKILDNDDNNWKLF